VVALELCSVPLLRAFRSYYLGVEHQRPYTDSRSAVPATQIERRRKTVSFCHSARTD
jgi:hypothetical protein